MIKLLLYVLISSLFVLDWLYLELNIGIRQVTWLPEFVSILIAVAIPFKTAINKTIRIPVKYALYLSVYILHLIIGFLFNEISAWTILAGLRIYTKFIPILLLPLIFPLSEEEFKNIIRFVFILAMLQLPVVLSQRFIFFAASLSGDPMGGTVGHSASGVLSIFLLIVISYLIAFYFKSQISLFFFIVSLGAAFIPTALNETKITFVLLPIAFIFPALFVKAQRRNIFRVVLVLMIFAVSFFVFKGIYDYFQQKRWGYGIETFVKIPGRLQEYSEMRIDPIRYAFINAVKDPRFIIFGRGAGNVSEGFTAKLSGTYVQEGAYYGAEGVSFTKFVWELGIGGTILFFFLVFLIFGDAIQLSREEGFIGAFSLGMLSFCFFFSVSMGYTFTMDSNLFVYLFFLCSGYIIQQRYEQLEEDKTKLINADGENMITA